MAEDKSVGSKIRQVREFQKISREELASRCSLHVEQIQKIEEDKVVPSLAPLMKIARAMGVRLGTFLDDVEQLGPVVVRSGELEKGVRFASQPKENLEHLNFFSLAFNKADRSMEPFIVDIEPSRQSSYMLSSHEGEEFIYVLDGVVEINYGKDIYRLEKGDSIYLDSIVEHNVHSGDNKPAKILAVVYAAF
ncbi:MAG: DNA-binding protein [Bacteroidetes bacterium GWF2_42_66]|nr:MAG: DNA-binding protein [Bacteroidetes bacterium GWA2_42_15]OFY02086.1 MAG: DNA-binding protein [Bacteroidetes bacterium GWE2_42_39]OFY43432.1 MAG: DNA-binding protein [Bacteroidetes bacterium GWF2_42_66]HBL76517.1 DNA-binding protein [Prolixibacteraceae bacterium]HCR92255.1 DNA-binding protein [Prolixibacteraceae bacterium]